MPGLHQPLQNAYRWNRLALMIFISAFPEYGQSGASCDHCVPTSQVPDGFREQAVQKVAAPCFEPPPLPGLDEYNGPMAKTVGLFARALNRKSVHAPSYKSGMMLCSLTAKGRFKLFIDDSLDPFTMFSAAVDAAFDQSSNRDPSYGQGPEGYAKRLGASMADRTSSKFLKDFAFPVIFSEDPRYYRLSQGPKRERILHAVEHLVVAHRSDDGSLMPNYSEWLGTVGAVALSNVYHPGEERGAGSIARRTAYRFAWNVGFDELREFWPDIARKFNLPFRGVDKKPGGPTNSNQ